MAALAKVDLRLPSFPLLGWDSTHRVLAAAIPWGTGLQPGIPTPLPSGEPPLQRVYIALIPLRQWSVSGYCGDHGLASWGVFLVFLRTRH